MSSINPLRGILDANRLTGPNYSDWLRNLKIVFRSEQIAYILEGEAPLEPALDAPEEEMIAYEKWKEDSTIAHCYMLASMSNELQRQHENMDARSVLLHLKELFGEQSRTERYEISKSLFKAHMAEGSSVQTHVLKMIEWIERLDALGFSLNKELSVDIILQSLPESFSQFIVNFNMNKIQATLAELLNMLKTAEGNLQKEKPHVLLAGKTRRRNQLAPRIKLKELRRVSVSIATRRGTGRETARNTLRRKRRKRQPRSLVKLQVSI